MVMRNEDVYLGGDMYEKLSSRMFTVPDVILGEVDEKFTKAAIKQF